MLWWQWSFFTMMRVWNMYFKWPQFPFLTLNLLQSCSCTFLFAWHEFWFPMHLVFIHLLNQVNHSLTHSHTHSFIHSSIHPSIHSFIHSNYLMFFLLLVTPPSYQPPGFKVGCLNSVVVSKHCQNSKAQKIRILSQKNCKRMRTRAQAWLTFIHVLLKNRAIVGGSIVFYCLLGTGWHLRCCCTAQFFCCETSCWALLHCAIVLSNFH